MLQYPALTVSLLGVASRAMPICSKHGLPAVTEDAVSRYGMRSGVSSWHTLCASAVHTQMQQHALS